MTTNSYGYTGDKSVLSLKAAKYRLVYYNLIVGPCLDRLADVFVQFDRHLVHSVTSVVVHHGVRTHKKHVSLQVESRPDLATLHSLPDLLQIHRPLKQ